MKKRRTKATSKVLKRRLPDRRPVLTSTAINTAVMFAVSSTGGMIVGSPGSNFLLREGIYLLIALLYSLYLYRFYKVRRHAPYLRTVKWSPIPSRNVLLLQNPSRGWRFAEIYEEARRLGGIRRGLDKLFELCDEATAEYIDYANTGIQDSPECREVLQNFQTKAEELAGLLAENERTRLMRGEDPAEPIIKGTIHEEYHGRMLEAQRRAKEASAVAEVTDRVEAARALHELGGDPALEDMMDSLREDIDLRKTIEDFEE